MSARIELDPPDCLTGSISPDTAFKRSRAEQLASQFRHDPRLLANTIEALRLAGKIRTIEATDKVDNRLIENARDAPRLMDYIRQGLASQIGDQLSRSSAMKFEEIAGRSRLDPIIHKATLEVLVA
jgi:hypothetical protein